LVLCFWNLLVFAQILQTARDEVFSLELHPNSYVGLVYLVLLQHSFRMIGKSIVSLQRLLPHRHPSKSLTEFPVCLLLSKLHGARSVLPVTVLSIQFQLSLDLSILLIGFILKQDELSQHRLFFASLAVVHPLEG
jgi:hypothetical protein